MAIDEKTQNSSSAKELISKERSIGQETKETTDEAISEQIIETRASLDDYRTQFKSLIESEVINIMEEEIRKAKEELLAEQKKALLQVVDEHRTIIRELVEEEKKTIWQKAEELRRAMLRFGL